MYIHLQKCISQSKDYFTEMFIKMETVNVARQNLERDICISANSASFIYTLKGDILLPWETPLIIGCLRAYSADRASVFCRPGFTTAELALHVSTAITANTSQSAGCFSHSPIN